MTMTPTILQYVVAGVLGVGTLLGAVHELPGRAGAQPAGALSHADARLSPSASVAPSTAPSISTAPSTAAPTPTGPTRHRLVWLNAWANHHTAPGGDASWALSGTERMRLVVDHLRRLRADVGVLAEVELPQREAFDSFAGSDYGQVQTPDALDDVVVYRRDVFRLVSAQTFQLRYQRGSSVRTPVVVLAERSTGRQVAVVPVHLPATTPAVGDQHAWRSLDVRTLAAQVRPLKVPVIVAGDFNSRNAPLCELTGPMAGLTSPLATHAGCHDLPQPPIDQAFFSQSLAPYDYRVDRSAQARRTTDHGALYDAGFTLGSSGSIP